jgi:hypothetical protein
MSQFTGVAPGLWVQAKFTPDIVPTSDSATNRVWSNALAPQFFVLGPSTYRVITQGNDSYANNGNTYLYWVRLISDPDGSLNGTARRISGDEVNVWTWLVFQNGTYTYTLNSLKCYWSIYNSYSDSYQPMADSDMTGLRNALTILNNATADRDAKAYLANMLQLASNASSQPTRVSKYAYFAYWIDEAFRPKFSIDPTGFDFEAFIAKHRFLTFVAYNDTNHNNILDFVVNQRASASPTITGTEAMYVFRPISADSVQGFVPILSVSGTEQQVNWGFKITGLLGNMTNAHPGAPLATVQTEISSVEFDFHFTRNATTALVKVDEKVGQFNVPGTSTVNPEFLGLSLAIVYYSYFQRLGINYQIAETDAHGNAMDNAGNTTLANALKFRGGGDALASVQIGGDTYIWNGTSTLNAYSNTMPWFSYKTYFSELGDMSVVNVSYGVDKSVYAACFPSWSGYSIVHDPYFAVFTASMPGEGLSPIMLIVAGGGIGVLAAAVVLLVRRRRVAEAGIVKTA